jgi:hypothetical protein
MSKLLKWVLSVAAVGALSTLCIMSAGKALAQDLSERVRFALGANGTVISGTIRGDRGVNYVLGASAGQQMSVDMAADNASAYFNIRRSGSDSAIWNGSIEGNRASVLLPSGGDWIVQVYLMRNAARRGEVANFRLSISIEGKGAAARPPATGAGDAEASGPDWWAVTGVGSDDALNVRQGPSVNDRVIARVANGTVLRNGGCVGEGRSRWCEVSAADDSFTGWASGRFLRESGAPALNSTPALAMMPETCRSAVAQTFDLPIRSIAAYPAQTAGRGFEVFAESNDTGRQFNCSFGSRGQFLGID